MATLIATGASEAPRSGKAACRLDAGSVANQRDGDSADVVAAGAAVGNGGGVRLGPTSYRLVSAKSGGDTVGAASNADRPGVDGVQPPGPCFSDRVI